MSEPIVWHAGEYVICAADARRHLGALEALNEFEESE